MCAPGPAVVNPRSYQLQPVCGPQLAVARQTNCIGNYSRLHLLFALISIHCQMWNKSWALHKQNDERKKPAAARAQ